MPVSCRYCHKLFPDNSSLHAHVGAENHQVPLPPSRIIKLASQEQIDMMDGLTSYSETRAKFAIEPLAESSNLCVIDTGFGSTAIDKAFLHDLANIQEVQFVSLPMARKIRGIGGTKLTDTMAKFSIYLSTKDGSSLKIPLVAYVLTDLGAKILIGNDAIVAYKMVINNAERTITLPPSNGREIVIRTIIKEEKRTKLAPVRLDKTIIVPALTHTLLSVRTSRGLKTEQDYHFATETEGISNGIVSSNFSTILFTNNTEREIVMKRGKRIGSVTSVAPSGTAISHWAKATEEINAFFGFPAVASIVGSTLATVFAFSATASQAPVHLNLDEPYHPIHPFPVPKGIKIPDISTSTYQEVQINPDLTKVQQSDLKRLAKRHRALFNDTPGIAREPKEEWLRIPVPEEKELSLKTPPLFRNSPKDKIEIDKIFDKNVELGRLCDVPIGKGSPYALQVFVVHRNGKPRPVVDMRPLNAMVPGDSYPIPR